MTRLTWWRRTAAPRNHPLLFAVGFSGTGLAIIVYYLAKYGFSNTILCRQLLIGLCAGLVFNLFYIWRYQRNLRGYVDQELGLGRAESGGVMVLRVFVFVACMMALTLTAEGSHMFWPGYGAFLLTWLLSYPQQKALYEGIKAKLAEMENPPQHETME